jgi:hypothetical protein
MSVFLYASSPKHQSPRGGGVMWEPYMVTSHNLFYHKDLMFIYTKLWNVFLFHIDKKGSYINKITEWRSLWKM